MRPLFGGDGCAINEAGISTAGNPLSRLVDAATHDPLHAQQMREGYLAGMRPPMGFGPAGQMLDPMMGKPSSGLEQVWHEVAPMHGPRPMGPGPMLGAAMPEQLMQRMQAPPGAGLAQEPGFFMDGPMSMPQASQLGGDWAKEFGAAPSGPAGLQMPRAAIRPPGADWAAEFAGPMHGPGPADMEAAFHHAQKAQMEAAFAEAQQGQMEAAFRAAAAPLPPHAEMEEAFRQAAAGPQADMEAAFQQAQEAQMEAAFAEAQQDQADLGQAAQMVEMLRNSGNPKFANSQFVNFIDKVSKGDLQFKENTVIDRDGNQVDWDTLYDTESATATDAERKQLESLWEASGGAEASGLEQAWNDAEPRLEDAWQAAGTPSDAELERLWSSASRAAMDDAWRLASEDGEAALLEQAWLGDMERIYAGASSGRHSEYQFSKENKYLESDDPLAEAMRLLREGRDREALLALEAEVQRNPESSEGWRQLGQLYAELDQDVEAIQCLRRGHEVDPYNLDSLLALGVSCTNELDQLPALRYLRLWIENHEEHQALVQGVEPPAEYEYEAWRQQVTALFNQAAQGNPLDANVFVALGVLENINRNYDAAIQALATACRLRPNDHTVWNKLGATLANSGKSEQAVVAYDQGLQLKPNYARSWSNLAIAHANLGQHADAARFYLSSLVLNPEATHIWNFLHSAVLNMNNVNAFEAIDQRDLAACTRLIDGVLDPLTLPKPKQELSTPPDQVLASIGL
mmetsp:Transcript_111832/g.311216  ORF Transcript_111832/g.311216 Transcript_111832/m.311216 type:complete len:743 (-) Transcript_111832:111-2339(-)